MLEASEDLAVAMEKKNSSRTFTPPKADNKKSDNGNFNKQGKFGRRRETSLPKPRNDGRRPTPQKSGGFDKRPRPRGNGNGRKTEEVMGDCGAEIGSALRTGTRKTNLNHLLNFTYEPRGHSASNAMASRGSGGWKRRNNWIGKSSLKYNKEQFLQANCQFVVREGKDYQIHAADPDTLVDWDSIEQVRIMSHEVPSCPICLYPPTAAKITRCGHIYCWPCILHYLSLGEKSWRKCPICYEAVHAADLKSVVALESHAYCAGEYITMKLMRRERGSTFAMPARQWRPREGQPHNLDDDVDVCYAKLLVANIEQVEHIVSTEREALLRQKEEEGETLDGSYIDAALDQITDREVALKEVRRLSLVTGQVDRLSLSSSETESEKSSPASVSPPSRMSRERVIRYKSAFSDEEEEDAEDGDEEKGDEGGSKMGVEGASANTQEDADAAEAAAAIPVTEREAQPVDVYAAGDSPEMMPEVLPCSLNNEGFNLEEISSDGQKDDNGKKSLSDYYFYQAVDGQHIYLNSINARCLLHEYGSWERCPETITGAIVELDGLSMNQDIRKRLRYLGHLPLTCEFQLAELDLTPPTVSKETLDAFHGEIEKRKKFRRNKAREDKRMTRKIMANERKKMGIGPGLRVSLESPAHFPQYYENTAPFVTDAVHDTDSMVSSDLSSPMSTPIMTPIGSPGGLNPNAAEFIPASQSTEGSQTSVAVANDGQQTGSLSFAQMLQAGRARPVEKWSRPPSKTSAGTIGSESKKAGRRGFSESEDSDSEDHVPVPVFQASFGSAIQEALDSFLSNKGSEGTPAPKAVTVPISGLDAPKEGQGKKKKKVKTLLFTTTMARKK